MRRTHSLIHRGYLYAQKRYSTAHGQPGFAENSAHVSETRMRLAKAYKDGYLAARRDAKKGQ